MHFACTMLSGGKAPGGATDITDFGGFDIPLGMLYLVRGGV